MTEEKKTEKLCAKCFDEVRAYLLPVEYGQINVLQNKSYCRNCAGFFTRPAREFEIIFGRTRRDWAKNNTVCFGTRRTREAEFHRAAATSGCKIV